MNEIYLAESRSRIFQDPSLSEYGKVQALAAISQAASAQPEAPHITYGDVMRGAIGAGLGYGVSSLLGRFLGADDDTISKMRTIGMGLGTMINTGMIKGASVDDQNAFRMGFIKACSDLGVFAHDKYQNKTAAMIPIMLPLTPDTFLSPLRAGYNVMTQGAVGAGAGLAAADAPDDTDTEMVKMELERQELERQAAKIEATNRNRMLKALLLKRKTAG